MWIIWLILNNFKSCCCYCSYFMGMTLIMLMMFMSHGKNKYNMWCILFLSFTNYEDLFQPHQPAYLLTSKINFSYAKKYVCIYSLMFYFKTRETRKWEWNMVKIIRQVKKSAWVWLYGSYCFFCFHCRKFLLL